MDESLRLKCIAALAVELGEDEAAKLFNEWALEGLPDDTVLRNVAKLTSGRRNFMENDEVRRVRGENDGLIADRNSARPGGVPGGSGGPQRPGSMQVNQGVMSIEDQNVYQMKLRNMRGSVDSLKTRARQCRQEGNHEAAHKLEVMLSVLEGRRVASLEYLNHLETWIARKQDFLNINAMTGNPNHMGMNDPVMIGDHRMMGSGQVQNPYGHPGYNHGQFMGGPPHHMQMHQPQMWQQQQQNLNPIAALQPTLHIGNQVNSMGGGLPGPRASLNDAAREELASMKGRFDIDPNHQRHDANHIVVLCKIRNQPVPPLRLIVPTTYPSGNVTVGESEIVLDAYLYEELQNSVHERLSEPGLSTLSDFLNTWEEQVNKSLGITGTYRSDGSGDVFDEYESHRDV